MAVIVYTLNRPKFQQESQGVAAYDFDTVVKVCMQGVNSPYLATRLLPLTPSLSLSSVSVAIDSSPSSPWSPLFPSLPLSLSS